MSALSLIPSTLTTDGKDSVATSDALAGADYIGIYFSAHWCPPCRMFTPMLSTFFTKHGASKKLKVIFASSDRDEESFKGYLAEMSWKLAIPFGNPAKEALSRRFKVSGIPTLVILDKEGNTVTEAGREKVMRDADAADFPWAPKPVTEVIKAAKLTDRNGKEASMDSLIAAGGVDVLGFYFSAHWCPPCRKFTPELAAWYEKHVAGAGADLKGKVDIVFCSGDKSQSEFDGYLAEMPWKAIQFTDKKTEGALSEAFGVEGIPTLVFIDAKTGKVMTKDGRAKISAAPEDFPWPAKPVDDLESATEYINDVAVCVVFADSCTDDAAVVAASEALESVAKEYFDAAKKEPSEKIRFAIATGEHEDAALSIRNFLGGAHRTDKAGPQAIRVTILDVPNRVKAHFKDGKGPVDAAELSAFVKSFLEGSAATVGIRS